MEDLEDLEDAFYQGDFTLHGDLDCAFYLA